MSKGTVAELLDKALRADSWTDCITWIHDADDKCKQLQTKNNDLRAELTEWQCGIMGDDEIMKAVDRLEIENKRLEEALKLAKKYITGFDGLSPLFSVHNALGNIDQALKGK